MRSLLDINVLIALLDSGHVMHERASQWLEANLSSGWASCPLTENGVIRIMSQPAYPNPQPMSAVAARLREAQEQTAHQFWADELSLVSSEAINWKHILGHRQVTDAYLLALACQRGGRLVTLDRRINRSVVVGAEDKHLVALSE